MQFQQESDPKKIKEFIDLVENHKVDLRHYKSPVLVWIVDEGTVKYSFWEFDLLMRFGLENVDGWDFEEDQLFCPDWVSETVEEDDDDLDDEDDDDLGLICDLKFDRKK